MAEEKQSYQVAMVQDIPPLTGKTVWVGNRALALFHRDGSFFAIDDACPHRGASLGDGFLNGEAVLCPWHCFDFHLRTGCSEMVPHMKVATYEVRVEGEQVFVLV